MEIKFHEAVDDSLLKIAVIVSMHKGEWVFCKHRERNTYEVPAGHREKGESIFETAVRELYEETGALEYSILPVCPYSVIDEGNADKTEAYGMLFFADIRSFDLLPECEIERIVFLKEVPNNLTYPLIQPILIDKVKSVCL